MNEKTPESQDGTPASGRRSNGKILALVIGLVAVAGAGGIYATAMLSGNGDTSSGQCAAAIETGKALKPLLVGDIAAMANRTQANDLSALSFNGSDGQPMTLADTGGKPRLVNLWATWCAPCREEMPALDRLQAAKGGDDFEVIAISVDHGSDEKPRAFFDEIGIEHLGFYHDPTIGAFNAVKKEGMALGLPATMLIDENNCVVANMNGPANWASEDALKMVDAVTKRDM